MDNIVFFGQADAGKSTLAGYIVSRFDPDFKMSRFIDSIRRTNGSFDYRLLFSSIINTNRDEIEQANKINSRSLHLRKISMPYDKVTIIDTPGSESYRKQRERGMFYGNIGIFFMEINNILDHKYNIETLAPLALWSRLKNKKMIFLITKFDMVDYNKENYYQAVDQVQEICSDFGFEDRVTIIPTAIEVDRFKTMSVDEIDTVDLGENICSTSEKMPWYNGMTVVEAIEADSKELDRRDAEEPLLFCITDQVDRPDSYSGKVWNIKILSGILRVGQEICFAPVKDTNGNYSVLNATIKQLRSDLSRFDERKEVSIARKGEMYGIDIKNCSIEKHHVKKSEYNAVSSTCGFSANAKFLMSDIFSIKIEEAEIDAFKEGSEMRLVWFGRSLPFIVSKIVWEDTIIVRGKLKSSQISLPLFDKFTHQSILIKGQGDLDFFNCTLINIGE